MWGQMLICHHECLALLLYLVEGHKFLFAAKTFHVPIMNLKMKCKMLGKCAPMSYVLIKCRPHGGKNSKMKLVDGFLVEPQNQGRAGTSWEPSHEW
jgi:hypothetical protein